MFCSKCGCENGDNASFCKNCGEPIGNVGENSAYGQGTQNGQYAQNFQEAKNAQYAQNSQGMQYAPNYGKYAPVTTFAGAVIKTLSSSVMTALCIIMSIGVGFNLISSVFSTSVFDAILREALSTENIYLTEEINGLTGLFSLGFTAVSLPNIIILVGLWVMRGSARSAGYNGGMSTGGITVVKVVLTVQLIFQILAAVLCALVGVVFAVMSDSYDRDYLGDLPVDSFETLAIIVAGMFFIIVAVITVQIIYTALALGSAGNIKNTVTYNTYCKAPSAAYTVMSFIFAGFSLFSGSLINCAVYAMSAVVNINMKQNFNTVLIQNRNNFANGIYR